MTVLTEPLGAMWTQGTYNGARRIQLCLEVKENGFNACEAFDFLYQYDDLRQISKKVEVKQRLLKLYWAHHADSFRVI